jgi:hypothetical protein
MSRSRLVLERLPQLSLHGSGCVSVDGSCTSAGVVGGVWGGNVTVYCDSVPLFVSTAWAEGPVRVSISLKTI